MKRWLQWTGLAAAAAGMGFGAQALAVPGGWFVGPVLAALTIGLLWRGHPQVQRPPLMVAQTVVGALIGGTIRPESLTALAGAVPEVIVVLIATIGISLASGLLLAKTGAVSRETAVLGSLPGGASAMTLLSLETGADPRMVALMQYLRLLVVVMSSSLVAHLMVHPAPGAAVLPPVPQAHWTDYVYTLAIAVAGAWGGRIIKLPTAAFLGPMLLAVLASAFHLFHPVLPWGVTQIAYVVLGLYVGLLFNRESIVDSIKLLPLLVLNIVALLVGCALTGLGFAALVGTDALTGYLATSPGGADTIAIIALGAGPVKENVQKQTQSHLRRNPWRMKRPNSASTPRPPRWS